MPTVATCGSLSKRRAFCILVTAVTLSLAIIVLRDRSWYSIAQPTVALLSSTAAKSVPAAPEAPPAQKKRPLPAVPARQRAPVSPVRWAPRPVAPAVAASASQRVVSFALVPGSSSSLSKVRRTNLAALSGVQLENLYFMITEQLHIQCPSSQRIGEILDGGWDVCFSGPLDIRKSRPCVAFSFGINNIWGYDDQLADTYKCMVYMFDPSMRGTGDHQRKTTSWFYLTGLSSRNYVSTKGWKMRTLCRIFSELGYTGKTVDILKVDIEYWEWESFEQAIREGCLRQVKQLLFESHTAELVRERSNYGRFIRVWLGLFDVGFRTWKWHKNPQSIFYRSASGAERACCYEHYMINTNLL